MIITAFEGLVENGCIHLPTGVLLPEKSKVYVLVPAAEMPRTVHFRSPRLADPSQAPLFKLEVTEEGTNA